MSISETQADEQQVDEQHQADEDERERKNASRRRHKALMRQRALATVKAAGHRRILRLPEVEAIVGITSSQIYDDIERGTFPKPIPLSGRTVGWLETEIMDWVEARIAERDKAAA